MNNKPILCMDFDGVIHSYASGWVQPDFIPDPPVPGALQFLHDAVDSFEVVIFSSRSHQQGGIRAMQVWLEYWAKRDLRQLAANKIINAVCYKSGAWPTVKPPAFLTIDDRGMQFTGTWPAMETLLGFRPWNKQA